MTAQSATELAVSVLYAKNKVLFEAIKIAAAMGLFEIEIPEENEFNPQLVNLLLSMGYALRRDGVNKRYISWDVEQGRTYIRTV